MPLPVYAAGIVAKVWLPDATGRLVSHLVVEGAKKAGLTLTLGPAGPFVAAAATLAQVAWLGYSVYSAYKKNSKNANNKKPNKNTPDKGDFDIEMEKSAAITPLLKEAGVIDIRENGDVVILDKLKFDEIQTAISSLNVNQARDTAASHLGVNATSMATAKEQEKQINQKIEMLKHLVDLRFPENIERNEQASRAANKATRKQRINNFRAKEAAEAAAASHAKVSRNAARAEAKAFQQRKAIDTTEVERKNRTRRANNFVLQNNQHIRNNRNQRLKIVVPQLQRQLVKSHPPLEAEAVTPPLEAEAVTPPLEAEAVTPPPVAEQRPTGYVVGTGEHVYNTWPRPYQQPVAPSVAPQVAQPNYVQITAAQPRRRAAVRGGSRKLKRYYHRTRKLKH